MLYECTKNKITASRSFKKGELYDVRKSDGDKGVAGDAEGENKYLKEATMAQVEKFYDEKQKKAHNAKQIGEIQAAEKVKA